jgi:rifampin ADP-ribosylating transferase
MSATSQPVPFQVYEAGVYLHGTKAQLLVGEMLAAGRESKLFMVTRSTAGD